MKAMRCRPMTNLHIYLRRLGGDKDRVPRGGALSRHRTYD